MKATVHTLPNCVQCNQTKKLMGREGILYDVVKLEEHPELEAKFKDEGILRHPSLSSGTMAGTGRAFCQARS